MFWLGLVDWGCEYMYMHLMFITCILCNRGLTQMTVDVFMEMTGCKMVAFHHLQEEFLTSKFILWNSFPQEPEDSETSNTTVDIW